MSLDLEDYKPETPRVPQAISMREGVLASLLVHALMVIAYLVTPPAMPEAAVVPVAAQPDRETVHFVHMAPTIERPAPPKPNVEQSDLDRRASSPVTPPDATNNKPFSVGDTPEKVVGGREERPVGPANGASSQPAPPNPSEPPVDLTQRGAAPVPPAPQLAGGGLNKALTNLSRYLQDSNFDNQQGGQAERMPDIQFDSKGVEFGPWLRRFVVAVKRNWNVPQGMFQSGKVVIQMYVLRNGTIAELQFVSRSQYPAYDNAAFNALKNASPVLPLPQEYPDDRMLMTVTFYYDVRSPSLLWGLRPQTPDSLSHSTRLPEEAPRQVSVPFASRPSWPLGR